MGVERKDVPSRWYNQTVTELRFRQKDGENTDGDRKAVLFEWGEGDFRWELWVMQKGSWWSNPFRLLYSSLQEPNAPEFLRTEAEALAFVVDGSMPKVYERLKQNPSRTQNSMKNEE